jgi:hypothetical protein
MTFRFRKSIGFGFGRVNLSKSGVSLSMGARGNVVNIGKRGVRHTAGIPGMGMSWSHKIGGGSRSSSYAGGSYDEMLAEANDSLELMEAELELNEANYHEMDLLVKQAEDLLSRCADPKEEDVAKLETMQAQRHSRRVELDVYQRKFKRARTKIRNAQAWKITKAIVLFAVFIWIWSAWNKVPNDKEVGAVPVSTQHQSTSPKSDANKEEYWRRQNEEWQRKKNEEPAPSPLPRSRPTVQR